MKRLRLTLLLAATLAAALCCFAEEKQQPLPKDLPPYGPAAPFHAPKVEIKKLANGMTLWLVPRPGFPKVALTFAVRGGMASDPLRAPSAHSAARRTSAISRHAAMTLHDFHGVDAHRPLAGIVVQFLLDFLTFFRAEQDFSLLIDQCRQGRNQGFPEVPAGRESSGHAREAAMSAYERTREYERASCRLSCLRR